MKKKVLNDRDHTGYRNDMYDDMKKYLNLSRTLFEQVDFDDESLLDLESKREDEKTKEYTISSGVMITHGYTESDLDLTDDEKNTYQSTMDEFIEQVSDLVDYDPLNLYLNTVEWGGMLIKFDTKFVYTLGESNGVFISCEMTRLDDEFTETIEKLKSYYKIFSSKWAKVLSDRKVTDIDKGEEPANL
jgi:hypothetical protein